MPERLFFLVVLITLCSLLFGQIDENKLIRLDLLSSTKNELIQRAESLGLDTTGTRDALLKLLFKHYSITGGQENEDETLFIIKSADTSTTYTIDEINEDYISFSGDIYLVYDNVKEKARHVIEANTIIINNTKKLISALGDVKYTLEQEKSSDSYYGDEVIIHLDHWNGYFFRGLSQTLQNIDDKEIIFYFSGENMERTDQKWIILDKGIITSSNPDNPNYHISARKIIMPVPGEWLITNALLYVGHIPVMYIPYFYYAKDKLIFHPSVGYDTEEGYNMQNTLYFYGKSEKGEDELSLLQLTESKDEEQIGDGLFLRSPEEAFGHNYLGIPRKNEKIEYLKLILDFYANTGIFTGMAGKFVKTKVADELELFFALARTRYIPESNDEYAPVWHEPHLFTVQVPFRYGLDFILKKTIKPFTFNAAISFYSDPYLSDYYSDRSESFNWSKILGLNDVADDTDTTTVSTGQTKETANFSMTFKPDIKPDFKLISSFQISPFTISLTSKTGAIDFVTYPEYDKENVIRYFYYPYSFIAPNIGMNITGTVFNYSLLQNAAETLEKKEGFDKIKSPFEESTDKEENSVDTSSEYKLPETIVSPELILPSFFKSFEHSLTYNIRPTMLLSGQFDSEPWDLPSKVNYDVSFYTFSASPGGSLTYNMRLFQNLVSFSNKLEFTSNYYTRFKNDEQTVAEWDEQILNDKTKTNFTLIDTISLTTQPLLTSSFFSKSNINYNAGAYLFRYYFTRTEDDLVIDHHEYIDLTDNTRFFKHNLDTTLAFDVPKFSTSVNYTTTLPPLDLVLSSTYSLKIDPVSLSVKYSGNEDADGEWLNKPLNTELGLNLDGKFIFTQYTDYDLDEDNFSTFRNTAQLLLGKKMSLTNTFAYSFENESIETENVSLKFYDLDISFYSKYTPLYYFNPDAGWREDTNSDERLRFSRFKISYDKKIQDLFYWKNRIFIDFFINTSVDWDNLKVTNSRFDISLGATLKIYKFLDLSFSIESYNKALYRYFEGLADEILPGTYVDFFDDLIDGFNIFDADARTNTNFKLKKINIDLVHYLDDWTLTLNLNLEPKLVDQTDGGKEYEFVTNFSIYVQWTPIPEIQKKITVEGDDIMF
ncbi:MAG: LPS-assembly protein LptD [Spirochaetales bacterium]|nr:LPS-assembly protein LptD [Spirochaetales bacterium]